MKSAEPSITRRKGEVLRRRWWRRAAPLLALVFALNGCTQYATVIERRPRVLPPPPGHGLLVAAEKSIRDALGRDQSKPLAAIGAYLDAAETASRTLARDPHDSAARCDFNFAISRVFTTIRDARIQAWNGPLRVPGAQGEWEITGHSSLASKAALAQVEFIPCDQVDLRGAYVGHRSIRDGIGAPLVATLRDAGRFLPNDRFAQGRSIYYGVTAVARFEGRHCVISFEDPLSAEEIACAGHRWPLAADFTAPLAMMLARENPKKLELARLLRPGQYAETARLARLQPYDPAKIPVLCVHGLMDSPATWMPLLNALRDERDIREHYQFWFYSYPSGYPYPYSAAILRQELDAIDARYPGHKKIVLIGHSMGGVISRLMITDSGQALWLKLMGKPPEQMNLTPKTRDLLTQALIFKHRTDVGRVIFIAAPHRGSDLASNWLGRIGSGLVKAPATLVNVGLELKDVATFNAGDLKLNRIPNSVDTLAPNNRFVRAINTIPIAPGIPYHSIIGDRGRGDTPKSSDGVVPYWSSHLEKAQTELIVPSGHNAHQNPQAIEEVKRLLRLQIRSSGAAS